MQTNKYWNDESGFIVCQEHRSQVRGQFRRVSKKVQRWMKSEGFLVNGPEGETLCLMCEVR